jgi:penicillin amidase
MTKTRFLGAIGSALLLAVVAASCTDDPVPQAASPGAGAGGAGGAGGAAPSGITIPGLGGPVTATYDEHGLLHLACASDNDCFAALGYFHASNRFFFMDFVRNLVRGSLGSLVKAGDTVLQRDYANRHFFATTAGQPLEDKLHEDASEQVKGAMAAYTKGVNAWLGDMRAKRNGATLTTEYDFALIVKDAIRDWEPQDSAAIGLYVLNDLSNNSDAELSLAEELPAFDPVLAADLFSPQPVFDAFTLPASTLAAAPPPISLTTFERLAHMAPLLGGAFKTVAAVGSRTRSQSPGDIGSNNWVVGPDRTAGGHALLANDPHLSLTNPSIWFGVELDAKSAGQGGLYHAAGSTFPGLPAVMVGHNESIGWGVTTAYYDLADEYVEQVSADGKTVTFNGQDVPIFEKEFTFQDAATSRPVTKTFRWVPHHGPIVSEDRTSGTAISIRWRGHEGGTDLDAFFSLARAGSVNEARESLKQASSASQNFVVIDKAGNFGWFPYCKVPSRPWASPALPPWLPLPGDGSAEWQGSVPEDQLPQLLNPPEGVIATANQDLTGASADGDMTNDAQPALQAWDKAEGTRQQRILDLLEQGGNGHSMKTMQEMQADTYSLYGSVVVPALLAAAAGATLTADEQALVDALAAWAFTCPTGLDGPDPVMSAKSADPTVSAESIGCTAFHTALYALVKEALGDEQTAAGVDIGVGLRMHLVVRAIKNPASLGSGEALWDDVSTDNAVETRDEILVRAIQGAAAALASLGAPDEWRWGRVHTLSLRSIFDSFGVPTYNTDPYAAPGGQYTVNVASPSNRTLPTPPEAIDFAFKSGPSVRFVVEARSDGLSMSYELPGGADLHRESPFYNNLLPQWLVNEPIDFPFGPGAVTTPAEVVEVSPAP